MQTDKAKIWLDQASLHLNYAQRYNPRRPNLTKRAIKQTIQDLQRAYTYLDGIEQEYQHGN